MAEPIDLAPIKARTERVRAPITGSGAIGNAERRRLAVDIAYCDVPALVAEVERLRGERDALIARLRDAAGWHPEWLSTAAGMYEHEGCVSTAAILRVVADVIT